LRPRKQSATNVQKPREKCPWPEGMILASFHL
jgi:hypothetical protein